MGSVVFIITAFVLMLWISPARPQCSSSILQASCVHTDTQAIFLANDTSSSEQQLTITCPDSAGSGTLNGWSLSPDGTSRASDSVTIDTSSSKYTVNGNTLTVGNITSKDEGLYRCVYDQGQSAQLCVYVYARAVFASCPSDFGDCTGDPTPLSIQEGRSVSFNATVVHTEGGSCGFLQRVERVQLVKIDPRFGVDDEVLLTCTIDESSLTPCQSGRVSLNRGNDPGLEFTFTLTDAVADEDSSLYRVTVATRHPTTGAISLLRKTFRLEVEKSQAVSEGPQDEDSTSHSRTILKGESTTVVLMNCAIALMVLMFASRSI